MSTPVSPPVIRAATPADAPGIAAVHVQSWRETYADLMPADFLARMTSPKTQARREVFWQGNIAAGQDAVLVAENAAAAGATYQPKPGETLDQVIGKTMANSPLSMALLRQAFIDENPQAIIAGKVPKLRKGAALHIPNHDLLLRRVLASVTPVPTAKTTEAPVRALPASPEERTRWVQFP